MTPEQKLSAWFMDHLPHGFHAQRIETTIGRGIPDVNLCAKGVELWIELKAAHSVPYLAPEQYAWMTRRSRVGGNCFVLHRITNEWSLYHMAQEQPIEPRSGFVALIGEPQSTGNDAGFLITALYNIIDHYHATQRTTPAPGN